MTRVFVMFEPITKAQLEQILREELSRCSAQERGVFDRIRIAPREVPILRGEKVESVFAVGQHDSLLLVFEDVEQGFEWCQPDPDGVIRSYACSQAGLQARLYELLHHGRT